MRKIAIGLIAHHCAGGCFVTTIALQENAPAEEAVEEAKPPASTGVGVQELSWPNLLHSWLNSDDIRR